MLSDHGRTAAATQRFGISFLAWRILAGGMAYQEKKPIHFLLDLYFSPVQWRDGGEHAVTNSSEVGGRRPSGMQRRRTATNGDGSACGLYMGQCLFVHLSGGLVRLASPHVDYTWAKVMSTSKSYISSGRWEGT
jgi:hypothetical protein